MKSKNRVLAQRYARALASLTDAAQLALFVGQLEKAGAVVTSSDVFLNPAVPKDKLNALFSDIFKDADIKFKNLLTLIIENKKLALLPLIAVCTQELLDKKTNTLRAQVYCYALPTSAQKEQIENSLKTMFKSAVVAAEYIEDKALCGGIKIKTAGYDIDGSVKNNLEKLQSILEV